MITFDSHRIVELSEFVVKAERVLSNGYVSKMSKVLFLVALISILVLGTGLSQASVPQLIAHQGIITDSTGHPVADSTYMLFFYIYDAEFDGTLLWLNLGQQVATKNGIYSYLLGSAVSFPSDLFSSGADRWLAITLGGPEISPRIKLASEPFAIQAENADVAQSVAPDVVGTTEIADGSIGRQDVYQEDWIAPTLLNGWINYENGYNPAGYFKDVNGVVHLRGLVRDGPNNVAIFQLPAGYRPEYVQLMFALYVGLFSRTRVDILPDGTVRTSTNAPGWLSLDGLHFRADGN